MGLSFDNIRLSRRGEMRNVLDSGDAILIYSLLAVTLLVQLVSTSTPLRALFGLPLLFFFPGYALLLFLFPRRYGSGYPDGPSDRSLRHVERLLLSFGISLSLAPIVALGYALFEIPLSRFSVTVGFAVLTAGFLAAGEVRRRRVPRSERFVVPFGRWLGVLQSGVGGGRYGLDGVLNVALGLAVVFALVSLGYGLLVPTSGEQYTNFYLVTENETGGLVAAGYPANLTGTELGELIVGIDNREGRTVDYQVVVQLERVSLGEDGRGLRVLETESLGHRALSVSTNETEHLTLVLPVDGAGYTARAAGPASAGTHLRLSYLLYLDEAPEERSVDGAYRSVYLWLETGEAVVEDRNGNENGLRRPSPTRQPTGAVPEGA